MKTSIGNLDDLIITTLKQKYPDVTFDIECNLPNDSYLITLCKKNDEGTHYIRLEITNELLTELPQIATDMLTKGIDTLKESVDGKYKLRNNPSGRMFGYGN